MKALSVFTLVSSLMLWAWLALGGSTSPREPLHRAPYARVAAGSLADARLDAIRERADARFDEARGARRQPPSRTRVGPQPWPDDLPGDWPVLDGAQLLADSVQAAGDRLLLVDWPVQPARAVARLREALEARGYRIAEPRVRSARHALHARGAAGEIVLTVFARDDASRLEILFLASTAG
jgi:hypothetical protein